LGTHPCDSITESARTTKERDTGAAKRGRLKRLTLLSSIKASTIVDSRSSFLNFKLSIFLTTFELDWGLATGLQVQQLLEPLQTYFGARRQELKRDLIDSKGKRISL
jgi:hypothetical protein